MNPQLLLKNQVKSIINYLSHNDKMVLSVRHFMVEVYDNMENYQQELNSRVYD